MPDQSENARFFSHAVFMLCYLAALGAFGSLVNDLYLPSLPQMRHEFHATPSVTQLGLSFGMAGLGLGELYWGPLSDKIGRKPVLFMSLVLFMIAAAVSVFSPSMTFFLVCRLFQGLGGAGAVLLSKTIPTDTYEGRALAKIMAIVGAINGIAPAANPFFGGIMAVTIGWRGVFAVLALLALVMILLGMKVPESLPANRRKTGSIFKVMHEYRILMRNRAFMIHVLLKGSALGALFCYISAGPFIIEEHFGYSAFEFGAIFGGNALANVLGALVSLKFQTMKKAAVIGALGMTVFAFAEGIAIYFADSIFVFEFFILPMLFFSGMVFSSANTLAMSEGAEEAGAASAILGLSGYAFGCVVSPLVGLGNILLSTSICLCVCALIALYYGWQSTRLPAMKIQP